MHTLTHVHTHSLTYRHTHACTHIYTLQCDMLNTIVGWFRLYRAIVDMQLVICLESDYFGGKYLKWNVKENSIEFYVSWIIVHKQPCQKCQRIIEIFSDSKGYEVMIHSMRIYHLVITCLPFSFTFFLQHGKPYSPPKSEVSISWNLLAPLSDSPSYSNGKVLRAWTTQLDPTHPQNQGCA